MHLDFNTYGTIKRQKSHNQLIRDIIELKLRARLGEFCVSKPSIMLSKRDLQVFKLNVNVVAMHSLFHICARFLINKQSVESQLCVYLHLSFLSWFFRALHRKVKMYQLAQTAAPAICAVPSCQGVMQNLVLLL